MTKITVVLADDHPIVLAGVREVVEMDDLFEVVGEARTSSHLMKLIGELDPQIVITDFYMPGDANYGDGMRLITYLLRQYPHVKLLVLTMLANRSILASLYDSGVSGVILKNNDLNDIRGALKVLIEGGVYRGNFLLESSSVVATTTVVAERISSLSVKESEVLRLFISGMRIRDVAINLKRSSKTVSTQKKAVMRKLCVDSDQELYEFCSQHRMF